MLASPNQISSNSEPRLIRPGMGKSLAELATPRGLSVRNPRRSSGGSATKRFESRFLQRQVGSKLRSDLRALLDQGEAAAPSHYATLNSNHTPDGTLAAAATIAITCVTARANADNWYVSVKDGTCVSADLLAKATSGFGWDHPS
jgi:hypothetical protein